MDHPRAGDLPAVIQLTAPSHVDRHAEAERQGVDLQAVWRS
jgi:hypothetical protein